MSSSKYSIREELLIWLTIPFPVHPEHMCVSPVSVIPSTGRRGVCLRYQETSLKQAGQTTLLLSLSQLPHHKTLKLRFTMKAQRPFQK